YKRPQRGKLTALPRVLSQSKLDIVPAGSRLARTRNVLAASHTTELAAASATTLIPPCASRDADACVERAADPLNSGRIDAKPCSDPAHALRAPRLVQSLADSLD